jgi:TP901 family phage tail tape measure protein
MTDRSVVIRLKADVTDFTAKMKQAGITTRNALGRELDTITGDKKQAMDELGNSAGKIGVVAAAGLGLAVSAAANFDQAMSHVAATGDDARQNLDDLREAAIKAGADTAFSATEAAAGLEALAKAGVSSGDALSGGLQGALDLAAAGTIEVGEAAEIAATAMTQFGLSGQDVPHIADILAAAAGKAQGEVTDMAGALKYVGPVAAQMGVSIEETAGTIAELASQGILGEQAGTSLRGMLTALTSPSKAAATEMENLGISMYDASGQFVGFEGIAGQLHDTMGNLTNAERDQALGRIFGNEQITAARILYAGGAADVDKWTKAVDDQGYAAETAATKLDNLKGDLEALKGSLETALIGTGEGAQGPLRSITQGATNVVNAFNDLPPAAHNVTAALLGITAVTGGALFFGSKVVQGIASTRAALVTLGITADTTKAKLATLGTGAAVATVGLGTLFDTLSRQDSLSRSGDAAKATADDYQQLADVLGKSNVGKYASDLGIDVNRLAEDLIVNGKSGEYAAGVLDDLADSSHGVKAAFTGLASDALPIYTSESERAYDANKDLKNIIENSSDALGQGEAALIGATGATGEYADASTAAADAANAEAKAIQESVDAMRAKREEALNALNSELGYAQAVLDANERIERRKELEQELRDADSPEERARAREELEDYSRTLDLNTQAGIDNMSALANMAGAWNNQSAKAKNAKGAYKEAREELIDTALQFGATKAEARQYARWLLEIPPKVVTEVELGLRIVKGKGPLLPPGPLDPYLYGPGGKDGDPKTPRWSGGYTGDGGKYQPAGIVHAGEYVFSADATRGNVQYLDSLHRSMRGYASGGPVAATRPAPMPVGAGGMGGEIDYDRLAASLATIRPLYGDVHMQPHDYNQFRREMGRDRAAAGMDGMGRR